MRILQFFLPGKGRRVGLLDADERIIDITTDEISSVLQLILTAERERVSINVIAAELEEEVAAERVGSEYSFAELNVPPDEKTPHLLIPIEPPEVWGCGVTYLRSAKSRDRETETDLYTRAYNAERPEIFFKATASRCVGPNEPIYIRSDSNDTVPEPELAYVLDSRGRIIGFTIANDVSARDIEGENPLYLPQAKIFKGCCALGPIIATPSEITDPMDLNIRCRIIRDEELIYEGEANTSQMRRSFEEINRFLMRDNPIPTGTVVLTGTGVVLPDDISLEDGDIVEIEIDEIGVLSNPVRKLGEG
ncbi:fumarylacetoacetate hydrolase [Candidatus Poribacteria bacterium]|nr:MAG: fumarylacetoacetate hydrolase [Candidatus Poribacteria bacterium]